MTNFISASTCYFSPYHIVEQQRLMPACINAQIPQRLRCSHTQSSDVDEMSD